MAALKSSSNRCSGELQPDRVPRWPLLPVAAAEAGAAFVAIAVADTLLYGVDSYKVLRQGGQRGSFSPSVLLRGAGPVILLGSAPSLGLFFGLWTPFRFLSSRSGSLSPKDQAPTSILLGATLCALPASILCVPSDTLKKQLLLHSSSTASRGGASTSHHPGVRAAMERIHAENGWRGFFVGTSANLVKDIPFAAIKLGSFELLSGLYLSSTNRRHCENILTPTEASAIGFGSGGIVAIATTPLDVLNTWLKSGHLPPGTSMRGAANHILAEGGVAALFRGSLLRVGLVGASSSIFWLLHSHLKQRLAGAEIMAAAYSMP